MKKLISRSICIPLKDISYSEFFNVVDTIKQTLQPNTTNLDKNTVSLYGIWGGGGFDGINTDDAELSFSYETLETEEEYEERIWAENLEAKGKLREKEAKKLKAAQDELREKELYLKLKKKYG